MNDPESLPAQALLAEASPGLAAQLRGYLGQHTRAVEAAIRTGGAESGLLASRRWSKVFDGLLSFLFSAVHGLLTYRGTWRPVSLAAVGSFGRGAVSFKSDLDLRLLCPGDPRDYEPVIDALLYPLWDSGVSIGHQVVSAAELVELGRTDLPTATSLLDWRVLGGETAGAKAMLGRAFEGLFGSATLGGFLERLEKQSRDRQERFGGTVYLLEPDVKNGPGGIRDLDIAHWAARARWRVGDLRELVRFGLLVPREWHEIEAASEFVWRVRNLLHSYAGRRSDRLSFERQEQIATDLGHGEGPMAVERMMSEYYRQARAILLFRDSILRRAAPPPERKPQYVSLGGGLRLTNGAMSVVDPSELARDPVLALRLYDEAVRRDVPVSAFARDAIMRATSQPEVGERLRASEEAARLFLRLATVTARTQLEHPTVLHELHDVGLLLAMIPEFLPVVGRVHHDLYHVLTVDAHSVAAVERLGMLCRGELVREFPLASRLAAEIVRPQVLFLATLLHDIGKTIGGADHSERGSVLVRPILERLGFAASDIVEVQHLVRKHLALYHAATRRDLDDPRTVEEFRREVRSREGLRELYLLTVCDVSTTSPGALTSWKARMLAELYVATDRALSEGGEARDRGRTERMRRAVHDIWRDEPGRELLGHFLATMPERYLYAYPPENIAAHARFVRDSQGESSAWRLFGVEEPYSEVGVVADDRPGLLALITATLASAYQRVVAAQVYSWMDTAGRKRALDLFWVGGSGTAGSPRNLLPRLRRDLAKLLGGEIGPDDLGGGLRARQSALDRPEPGVETEVNVDNWAATEHTVLEITTRDRLGLLFRLARAIQQAGLTIELAKINTEGNRVADVFYVLTAERTKLTDPVRMGALKQRIRSALE
jgi:[protein-PII] uridylyltransferase